MTDREVLYRYRMNQAEETLADAQRMIEEDLTPRSIVNRSYYSMFYSLLALFVHEGTIVKTSKHSGIISIYDKEFVHTGKFEKEYSKTLHRIFNMRQTADYKELVEITRDEAQQSISHAKRFLLAIKEFIPTE
jgi:uncharacterized protein (UPF0332 family)